MNLEFQFEFFHSIYRFLKSLSQMAYIDIIQWNILLSVMDSLLLSFKIKITNSWNSLKLPRQWSFEIMSVFFQVLFCKCDKPDVCFKEEKEIHCSYKLFSMMFKNHIIWFPPEFVLHLGSIQRALHSAPYIPMGPTKDFKPFIFACVLGLYLFSIPSKLHYEIF